MRGLLPVARIAWFRAAVLSEEETREAVQEALDALPGQIAAALDGVAVIVRDRHPDGLMGIYDPTDGIRRIVVFREANPTRDEVRRTVLHEIGHHFGMDEAEIRGLGYG
jgi:predicted Zn-dependent protease with MMP-like domain